MRTIESVLEKLNTNVESTLEDLHHNLPCIEAAKNEVVDNSEISIKVVKLSKTCKNCDNTESWGESRYCPKCGIYPPTGQIYPSFQKDEIKVEVEQEITHWSQVIPAWGWITGTGAISIVLASIFIGINIGGTRLAGTWGLAQFALAASGVILSHILAYTYSLHKTDEFGVLSLVMKPFKIWNWVYRNLLDSQAEFNCAIWSLTALISAPLFISAINFEDLTDLYAVRKSSATGLEEAVQEKLVRGEEDEDLEGAISKFVDKAATKVTDMAGGDRKNEGKSSPLNLIAPSEPELLETDCVVIGFILDEENHPAHLVLAATVNGSLQYVGTAATEKLPPEAILEFKKRSTTLFRPRPLIPAPVNAYWLKPVMAVRVVHREWTPSRKLVEPVITELLADLDVEKKPVNKPSVKVEISQTKPGT